MKDATRDFVPCPICGVVETAPEFDRPRGPANLYPLVRCARCGLVFQKHLPSPEELEQHLSTAYGEPQRRFGSPVEAAIRLFRAARVRAAARRLPPGGRVLDVGCGRGLFLRMLRERGYEVRGTELSAKTAANADPDLPIDVGELEPGRYPDGSFDLISIWHVLEHLRFPDRTLEACARALKPGGTLLVAVPNYASLQARLGGELWFHLDLPRHLYQFTPDTLARLLVAKGFRLERLRTGQWEMDPFGLLQTALNRTGLRPNALYDVLRNHPDVKRDLGLGWRIALLGFFPIGMALALPVSFLFRLLDRAGTLVAVARKPELSASAP